MDGDTLIRLEGVGKKYCYSLKRSIRYGLQDIAREILGLRVAGDHLRPDEFWAVRDASFEVRRGQCLGIIGPNGAGKSTLLKMIGGIFPPDGGRIRVRGRVGTLIEVGAGFHPMLSGRENIYINGAILGLSKREIQLRLDDIISFAGLEEFIDSPVKHYSSGMFVRLGFSIAAHTDPDVFLVDEALAVGDLAFSLRCLNRIAELRRNGSAIIFVSHSELQVREAADSCILLEHGHPRYFSRVDEAFFRYHELIVAQDTDETRAHSNEFTGEAEIIDVVASPPNGEGVLVSGSPLRIGASFRVHARVSEVYLLLRIWSAHGQLAAVVDSRDTGTLFELIEGEAELSVDIDSLPLVPGRYRIGGGLRCGTRFIAWSSRFAFFEITSHGGESIQPGILAVSARCSVSDSGSATVKVND